MSFAVLALVLAALTPEQRYEHLMRDLFIADAHVDTPGYVVDEGYRLADEHPYYELDIPRMRRGHMGAVFFGIYTPGGLAPPAWLPRALECIDAVEDQVRRNPHDLQLAYTASDIMRARQAGKMAVLLGIEGGHMMMDSLGVLHTLFRLGVRYMTLTHFKSNGLGDSGTDAAVHNGLSPLGREVVAEMNRLGMMVDISHVSDKTFRDVLEIARSPVIASHSSARAISDIPRNMDDDMLRAVARNHGVVFVNFSAAYLDKKAYETFAPLRDRRDREIADMLASHRTDPRRFELKRVIQQRYRAQLPPVDLKVALRHIDHIAKVAGADHVGIGSDFDGISGMVPQGLEDVSKLPALVRGLIELGYSDADIRKIMGENMLRVMRANEAGAAR
jgi:membrane dipeptidase